MDIAFDVDKSCNGQAAVVESENCLSLPVVWDNARAVQACRIYALPGSFFNITLTNNTKRSTDEPHIWITHTEEAFQKLATQITQHSGDVYRCNKNYSDATCYSADGSVESSIRLDVDHPGYYCIITTNADDLSVVSPVPLGILWSFVYVSYDFEAIKSQYPVVAPWKYIDGKTETSVTASRPFNFTHKNCALLRVQCTDRDSHRFIVGNFVRRWDVAVSLTSVYAAIACVLVICVVASSVCLLQSWQQQTCHKRQFHRVSLYTS